jgi:hypothetical protein
MRLKILVLLIGTGLTGCASQSQVIVPSKSDAYLDSCGKAEEKIKRLGCTGPDGGPLWQTASGTLFSAICRRSTFDWHPDLIANITDCSQLDGAFWGLDAGTIGGNHD